MSKIIVEYIWLDAKGQFRSKAKTVTDVITKPSDLPVWNFDGSSTGQAEGHKSEVNIIPQALFRDPFRKNNNLMVICDCYDLEMDPIPSNKRFDANQIFNKVIDHKPWFGLEQEYVLYNIDTQRPLGWPEISKGDPEPQGKYYCGVGTGKVFGREIVDKHYEACIYAGVNISGINAEVMPGQWEFQVGPCEGIDSGDHMTMARYLLERVCEQYNVTVSYDPKPEMGDWNGSGCHMNYSSIEMRTHNGLQYIYEAIQKLAIKHMAHIEKYGDNSKRLSGKHETSKIDKFTYGVADRTASIRIPIATLRDGKGYFEDRRPASDCDPYVITSLLANTVHLENFN